MQDRTPQCLFDPRKSCNRLCLLRNFAEEYAEKLAHIKNLSVPETEEIIRNYRHSDKEIYILLNRVWASALKEQGYDTYCYNGLNDEED